MLNEQDVELQMLQKISERVGGKASFELSPIEVDFLFIKKQGESWLYQCPTNSSLYMFTQLAKKHLGVKQ